jgi:hypothetical protein
MDTIMLRIVVDTPEEKEALIAESKVLHDVIPTRECPILGHIWFNPHMIEVKKVNTRYDAGGK